MKSSFVLSIAGIEKYYHAEPVIKFKVGAKSPTSQFRSSAFGTLREISGHDAELRSEAR